MLDQCETIENGHRHQNDSCDMAHARVPKAATLPPHDSEKADKTSNKDERSDILDIAGQTSSGNKLSKWQASLIYITNQVGIGILGLPAAMQTLGLIPGIICIIGLGKFETRRTDTISYLLTRVLVGITVMYTAYVLLQFFRRYPSVLSCVDCFRIIGGTPLSTIVGIGFVLNQLFACSSAIITMSIALNSISEHAMCTILFILIPTIVSCVLCMPRRMKFLADFGSKSSSWFVLRNANVSQSLALSQFLLQLSSLWLHLVSLDLTVRHQDGKKRSC